MLIGCVLYNIYMNKYKYFGIVAFVALFVASISTLNTYAATCGGVETSLLDCGSGDSQTLGGVGALLKLGVQILTGLIGAGAIGAVVYAGILYTTAGGNSDQTKKAIGLIRNVVIGIIAYALMYFLLNWLVPGGVPIL